MKRSSFLLGSFFVGNVTAFSRQQFSLLQQQKSLSQRHHTILKVLNGEPQVKEGPTSKTFFDVEEEHEGEVCILADTEQLYVIKETGEDEQRFWITVHRVARLVPIIAPIVAYFTYEELASSVNLIEGA